MRQWGQDIGLVMVPPPFLHGSFISILTSFQRIILRLSYEGHLSSYRQLLNQTGSTPLFILNLKALHRTNENKLPWPLFLNFIITLIIFLSESCLSKSERFLNLIKKETLEVIFYLPIPNDILGMMSYIKLKKMSAMLNLVYL